MNKQKEISSFPLVSVIIPAYNAEVFIEKTLNSVLAQTYQNIEVLIVDDGSRDRTVEIVQLMAQLDRRIKLIEQPNKGVAAARNLAIEKSQGQYIAPIDADDIWYPQKLEKQMQCMLQSDSSVGLVYAWSVLIDDDGLLTGKYHISREDGEVYIPLLLSNFVGNASTPLIRRSCLEQVGSYNCQLKKQNAQGCEDWDLYLRLAEYYHFRFIPEFLIGYRQTAISMSCNVAAMKKSYLLLMADAHKRNPRIPATIYQWSLSSYYLYLAYRCYGTYKYCSSLLWLYKSIAPDPAMLSNTIFYRLMLAIILKILVQLCTSLVLRNQSFWLNYEYKLKHYRSTLQISDVYNRVNNHSKNPFKNPYSWIKAKRFNKYQQEYNQFCLKAKKFV